MDLINKIQPTPTKTTFSVPKGMLYLYGEIGKWTSKIRREPAERQSAPETFETIFCSDSEILKNIEEKIGLSFVSEKEEEGNVCMVNSREVRDEYKNSFTAKDLLDYVYALLHSPRYLEKYTDLSKIDFLEIPYPTDQNRFWKLASLGAQLQQLHLSDSPYCPLFRC